LHIQLGDDCFVQFKLCLFFNICCLCSIIRASIYRKGLINFDKNQYYFAWSSTFRKRNHTLCVSKFSYTNYVYDIIGVFTINMNAANMICSHYVCDIFIRKILQNKVGRGFQRKWHSSPRLKLEQLRRFEDTRFYRSSDLSAVKVRAIHIWNQVWRVMFFGDLSMNKWCYNT